MAVLQNGKVKAAGIWLVAIFLLATHVFLRSAIHAAELPIAGPTQSDWQQVQTRTGDCAIDFPAAPKLIQQSLNVSEQGHKLTYDVYLAPLNDQSLCLLLVAVYPYSLKGGHELAGIEGLLSGIIGQSPDNKLLFANVIQQGGHPTVDFLVQSPTSYFRGQALMVGNKLYLMAIEGISGSLDEESFARFAQSFSLLPAEAAK
jgi:hypothetical protein